MTSRMDALVCSFPVIRQPSSKELFLELKRRPYLFGDALFHLEQGIQPARFDSLQKSRSDVHVSVEGVLSRSEFGKGGDGSLEVGSIRREVT